MTSDTPSLYSQLPATDRLLRDAAFQPALERYGHRQVVDMLRALQDEARQAIREQQALPGWCADWAKETISRLGSRAQSALRPVYNLSGTVLHTNLGRALQAQEAVTPSPRRCALPSRWNTISTAPGAVTVTGRWLICFVSLPARKTPASSITTRRQYC